MNEICFYYFQGHLTAEHSLVDHVLQSMVHDMNNRNLSTVSGHGE